MRLQCGGLGGMGPPAWHGAAVTLSSTPTSTHVHALPSTPPTCFQAAAGPHCHGRKQWTEKLQSFKMMMMFKDKTNTQQISFKNNFSTWKIVLGNCCIMNLVGRMNTAAGIWPLLVPPLPTG